MFVITGATGNIGSRAAQILLEQGEKVRVVGRDAAKLDRLVAMGGEAAVGDLLDETFLTRAFAGAHGVFAMIPPNVMAHDFRDYQNRVGAVIAAAIAKAGVRHVVNLSSQGADLAEGTGPILGLRDQEARLDRLEGVQVLHLRPTYFMENLLSTIPLIHRAGIAGSPVRGDRKFAMIATRDIASHLAARLVCRDFSGKRVQDLLGERDLSLNEAFTVIGRSIGKPDLKYVQFSPGDTAHGMKEMGLGEDFIRLYLEMSSALNDGLFAVDRPRNRANTTPTTIEEFAGTFTQAFAAAAPRQAA
jgi:uncharacterized protein YbjT (DUF2867 family)